MSHHKERHRPPEFGWRKKFNQEFQEKPSVFVFPRLTQVTKLAGLAYRYIRFVQGLKRKGKTPFIDPYTVGPCKQIYGVPLGGIGCGSIGRGWQGDFNRWQMIPGMYTYNTVQADQFTVCIRKNGKTVHQQVLSPTAPQGRMNFEKHLQGWTWKFDPSRVFYHALYPRAWTVYEIPDYSLVLTCRQVSPIIPHNYKDSSLPACVFVWTVENVGFEDLEVSIMFTFQNGDGSKEDASGGHINEGFCCRGVYSEIKLQTNFSPVPSNTDSLSNDESKVSLNTNDIEDDDIILDADASKDNIVCSNVNYVNGLNCSLNSSYDAISTHDVSDENDDMDLDEKSISDTNTNDYMNDTTECGVEGDQTQENCISHDVNGVLLHHKGLKKTFTLAIAALQVAEDSEQVVHVSTKIGFDPKSPGTNLWSDLHDDGRLTNKIGDNINKPTFPGQHIAAAVCANTVVKAGCKQDMNFVLTWDQPVVKFGSTSEIAYLRWYTRYFGSKGNACPSLCCYALQNVALWEEQIEKWQAPILEDSSLPVWFKSALFNETYFVSDGGTVWLDIKRRKDIHGRPIPDAVKKYGRFAYLEGHEYRMYNTYDVHFYASWSIAMLWPKLQLSLQYDVATSVLSMDSEIRLMLMHGGKAVRKAFGCVPHDLGDPDDEPFVNVNAYCIHDTSNWKDLNLHFVLQVYRDYYLCNDKQFLMDMWPAVKCAMLHSLKQDVDGDGVIDNSGFADQTFDCWVATGPSAYTGGLWLSALRCMIKIAEILELEESMTKFKGVLERGKRSFERKLWNGTYFNYDGSESEHHNCIMSGQFAGQWYLHACDIGQDDDSVFRKEQVKSCLKVIFQNNVMRFEGGFMGAVNGMRANGVVDTQSLQAEEVWTGVTYALASTMIQQGMVKEGFRTAEGIYRTIYEKWGLGFQTPEAITAKKTCRSRGYMRPLSIWSMYHSYAKRKAEEVKDDGYR